MKHIIIGGVAGGATAAARIRRADENAEIVLVEKGKYISYANCGLPYYIGGVIKSRDKLFVQTPEAFSRRFNVDVRTRHEALSIDTERHEVSIRRADGTTYTETYDRLLLSPGAEPVRPPLEGIDTEGIFTLRNVDDTDRIHSYLGTHRVRHAVVVGGGFIGLEMAENLHHAGAGVSIVEMADQVMAPVDFSIASHVHRHLMDKGVGLWLGRGVERFTSENGSIKVWLNTGETLSADLVLLSIGVRPSVRLAREAGIELGARGIKVNRWLQTSSPDVYAVGDAIEYEHPIAGGPWLNYLAGPANRQARIAADNMVYGNREEYEGSIGTSVAKVFDITVGATGLAAKHLKRMGVPYLTSVTTSSSHAGYYPGAFNLTLKLTFAPDTGRIYGAQCVGVDGVDKRIDEIAMLIKRGGTVRDLVRTEQAYAPPFSSAKDPVAIAGYVACNTLDGVMPVVTWRELAAADRSEVCLVDVRTPEEYSLGTIDGAVNIPLDDLRGRLGEIDRESDVIVFCAVGLRGYLAQRILLGRGYRRVRNLAGGYKTYSLATQKVEPVEGQPCGQAEDSGAESGDMLRLDACGLQCPGPIMQVKNAVDGMKAGQRIEVRATDPGFARDAESWCRSTGNKFVSKTSEGGYHTVVIEKREACGSAVTPAAGGSRDKTFIMFSDSLDRAIATFVLANGAAATGGKVTIFFTFWGLNVIKKRRKPHVEKDIFGRMFAWMLPSDSTCLHLSKMSMLGLGDRLMRHIMRRKNISQLEELMREAVYNGVELIACQMTMDMMGISRDELIDGVTVGGVATYMERAGNSGVNLFI
ncbi:FAD-dependent oxidoreductase [Leyella lascolaii]|uniref:FAD-dependent oxidoreductase n=1 Tax=Leyella lascolaii TaxID=1776379 RepID=A0AAW7JRJ7_9BACT|nr:FAD-dependent oxidoreductase [Leyella lascolaii]MDN0022126.1 FAD-dependent oxidoreductase [Leyella lascolaii]MDN0024481.1 FAD-dependent oxidoreductase [Leyella lascolaii]